MIFLLKKTKDLVALRHASTIAYLKLNTTEALLEYYRAEVSLGTNITSSGVVGAFLAVWGAYEAFQTNLHWIDFAFMLLSLSLMAYLLFFLGGVIQSAALLEMGKIYAMTTPPPQSDDGVG